MTSSEEQDRKLFAVGEALVNEQLRSDRAESELERTEGDFAVAVREARQARDEASRLRRVVQAVEALCDAADGAGISWGIQVSAIRAALAEGSGEQPTCEHGETVPHNYGRMPDGSFDWRCPGPTDDERPAT